MDNGAAAKVNGHDSNSHDKDAAAAPRRLANQSVPSINGNSNSKGNSNKVVGHKRSLSGSILSHLSFLRMQPDQQNNAGPIHETEPRGGSDHADDVGDDHDPFYSSNESAIKDDHEPFYSSNESAMALAHRAARQRKRKGSLRKTALLGTTGRLKAETRERRNSLLQLQRVKAAEDKAQENAAEDISRAQENASGQANPDPSHLPNQELNATFAPSQNLDWKPAPDDMESPQLLSAREQTQIKLSLATARGVASPPMSSPAGPGPSTLASPIFSPTSQSYTSTTDDDEALTLPVPNLNRLSMPTSGSYFPAQPPLTRRRSSKKPPSPLSAIPIGVDEEYEYSDTEWWGWVVLVVTWIVFVIGMGSSFGLWSWAWDVGETPYAPPELEDDPTLPIVGYYPALIILTGVMAWVWVVVAWVGMKYFKHAKMAGEDA